MRAIAPTIPPTTAIFAINKTTAITINNPTSPRITVPIPFLSMCLVWVPPGLAA